ncbi:hypothetical protein APT59_00835 [Pseudomonas oryzihabitans]|uniref:Uncharacterized protein n=1 Tax=Pseudomonas oryzihabitans TaxID=47885 RepID=A0A0U4NVZ0_9PSED|nr:hypothetical protein APT59_00835 [Pseudomonas oryzihabitans]
MDGLSIAYDHNLILFPSFSSYLVDYIIVLAGEISEQIQPYIGSQYRKMRMTIIVTSDLVVIYFPQRIKPRNKLFHIL